MIISRLDTTILPKVHEITMIIFWLTSYVFLHYPFKCRIILFKSTLREQWTRSFTAVSIQRPEFVFYKEPHLLMHLRTHLRTPQALFLAAVESIFGLGWSEDRFSWALFRLYHVYSWFLFFFATLSFLLWKIYKINLKKFVIFTINPLNLFLSILAK